MVQTILNVLLILLAIAAIVLVILYFLGSKLQKRQAEQQQMLDAAAQTVSILVIDKKKLKLTQSGLPKMVVNQTPKYMRWAKVPVVKAKIGPKVMTLIADAGVFESLPVKTEAKVVLSPCKTDHLGTVLHTRLWPEGRRRCKIYHGRFLSYHVAVPGVLMYFSHPRPWRGPYRRVDRYVLRLDREGNLLYKTVYEQKMAGVSCALT